MKTDILHKNTFLNVYLYSFKQKITLRGTLKVIERIVSMQPLHTVNVLIFERHSLLMIHLFA